MLCDCWLVFEEANWIDVEGLPGSIDGDDDGEADGGFGGGDHHYEEDEDLAADLVPHVGEGDEGQVDRVEHQLNRDEDGDDVALDEEGGNADGEEHRGEDEVVCGGYHDIQAPSSTE